MRASGAMRAIVGPQTLRLVLSLPPSANNLFNSRTGRRGQSIRVRSDAYEAWIEYEGYRQRWERLSEDPDNGIRWRTAIVAYGLPASRDVDNCIKPVVDLICRFTGLRDNWPHRRVTAERADEPIPAGEEPWLVVTVEVLGEGR